MKTLVCMMSVSTIWTVKAYDGDTDEITVDGYDITIEDNTDSETVVSTFVDGVNYQITFDKTDEEFEMVTSEYSAYFLGFGLGDCTEETFEINVENLNEDGVEAELVSEDTSETLVVSDDTVEVQAAAVVVVSGTAVAAALLKAILAITATIIVAGVVYYAAKSAIARLKRDQPQVHYYYAYLQSGDNVYIGPRIKSQSAAATVLRAGHNVFAISSGYAYNACKSASPISRVSSRQKHSGGGKNYYHYHPMITTKKQSHAHCWFI